MTRFVVVLMTVAISGVQGSLLYAAAAPSSGPPGGIASVETSVVEGGAPSFAVTSPEMGDGAVPASIECLRGGYYCFGLGTWYCCGEFYTLMLVSGAAQAWLATGVAAAAYYYYCMS
jgi:hypothetical protein